MTRPIVTIPRALMKSTPVDWDIDWREKSAGEGTGGTSQVVVGAMPRWVGSVSMILSGEAVLQWRGIRHAARGRTGLYRVPMFDPIGFSAAGIYNATAGVPFSTGERFSTGSGFQYSPVLVVASAAAAGAIEIAVTETQETHPLRPGMILSHDDWPIEIVSIDRDGADTTLTVAPFLRATIPEGGLLELNAHGLFECTDSSGNPVYDVDRVSRPTINFREWLNR